MNRHASENQETKFTTQLEADRYITEQEEKKEFRQTVQEVKIYFKKNIFSN